MLFNVLFRSKSCAPITKVLFPAPPSTVSFASIVSVDIFITSSPAPIAIV